MPQFVASQLTDPNVDPTLANAYNTVQRSSLSNLGAQQDLADRQTFRDNAAGLAAQDPTATGLALGANPAAAQGFLNSIPLADQDARAQAANNFAVTGSLASAALNAPASQRAAVWSMGRDALANAGYTNLPQGPYPGDNALVTIRTATLPVSEQLKYTPQPLSANPTPLLSSVPGGGSVGPGGAQAPTSPDGTSSLGPNAGGPSATYAPRMIGVESAGSPTAKNPNSSATGQGQFIDDTWLSVLPQVRPDLAQGRTPQQQLALRSGQGLSPADAATLQTQMVNGYAQQNAPKLAAAGIPVNDTTLAMAHRFGPDVAIQVASAPPNTPIGNIVGPAVMAVNRDLNGQTAGSVAGFYAQRVGGGAPARVQSAANVGTRGMPQTATDGTAAPANALAPAPSPALVGPTGPPAPQGYIPGGPVPLPPGSYNAADVTNADTPSAAQGLPGNAPYRLPDGTVHTNAVQMPQPAAQPPAALPTTPSGAAPTAVPVQTAAPAGPAFSNPAPAAAVGAPGGPQPGPLSGLGAGAPPLPPGPLSSLGQAPQVAPQTSRGMPPGVPGAPVMSQVQGGAPAAPSIYPFARDRMTGAYIPVPGQPGYAYALGPNGQPVAQLIPGAPGAGSETKVTPTGDVLTYNKSTGAYTVDRGVLPNTARIGQVNDGSTVHIIQPGSGEIGAIPLQPNTQKIQTDMYAEDRKSQAQQLDVAQQSQQQQVRLLEARQVMDGLPTGSGGEARAAWSSWAETYLPPAWAAQMKAKLNLPDAVPAQEFAKLMTQSAGQQERAVAGARGGIGMMTLFKNNNPGLEMQPGANQDLLNAQLVATQADADYAKGYVNFVNNQGQKLVNHQGYVPASQFDQQWLQQRNPQVYVAAAEAMSGKPFAFWSKGLTPDEGRRALQIVGGIDPTVVAQGSAGPLPVRQFMGAQ